MMSFAALSLGLALMGWTDVSVAPSKGDRVLSSFARSLARSIARASGRWKP